MEAWRADVARAAAVEVLAVAEALVDLVMFRSYFYVFYLLLNRWQVNFNDFCDPDTLFPVFALASHFYIAAPIEIGLASGGDDEGLTTGERHIDGGSEAFRKS